MNLEEKVKNKMSEVFGVDTSNIDANSNVNSLDEWDSVNHLELIQELENEFSITFSEDDIIDMLSYEEIISAIKTKI